MKLYSVIIICALFLKSTIAQELLNGDFEINYVDTCTINLVDSVFNAVMPNVISFGDDNGEVDILNGDCYFIGYEYYLSSAQSGYWYLGLATVPLNFSDAIALKTSIPMEQGSTYMLTYYLNADTIQMLSIGNIRIGISNNNTTFGLLIHTATPIPNEWNLQTVIFEAPINGYYITVKNDSTSLAWNFIDNFNLSKLSGYNTNSSPQINTYPNPLTDVLNIEAPDISKIELVSSYGQIIYKKDCNRSNIETIDVAGLSSGIYVCIISTDKQIFKKKVVKEYSAQHHP